jgi:hypothetical protein
MGAVWVSVEGYIRRKGRHCLRVWVALNRYHVGKLFVWRYQERKKIDEKMHFTLCIAVDLSFF